MSQNLCVGSFYIARAMLKATITNFDFFFHLLILHDMVILYVIIPLFFHFKEIDHFVRFSKHNGVAIVCKLWMGLTIEPHY